MRSLLDTNAYSALVRGHPATAERVRRSQEVLISTVVLGELLFGFRNGTRLAENSARLDAFLANPYVKVLPVTLTTADRFARIAANLKQKRRTIPTNDMWIAAHALETGADLVSFDQHFAEVDGLVWIVPDGP